MAYVMNPYSYKLGYSLSWSDDWFSNKKLYPVMLQILLTIRYFLIFFWTSRNIEKLDTYLSHLNLTLNSGKLLITLFFYEAKMNQPEKYKYKVLKHIIHSIPYSDRNPEFKVNWKVKNSSVNVRAIRTTSAVKSYFFYENTLLETFESQRFFLFFYFLGLDPASFLLEFYSRYGEREYGEGSNKKPLKNVIVYKRFKSLGKKYSPKMFIYQLEFIFLNRIYKFLNEKVFFFWLYDKEKNLNMVRFLRTLFFYGGMAYFGKYYAPLMEEPGIFFSRFPEINNIKKSKKVTNFLNIVKKKKRKNYNYFLQKLQIICYFSLLNLNYKEVLLNFKSNYKKHDLYNFLKHTLLNLKDSKKKNFFFDLKRRPTNRSFYKLWWKLSKKRAIKIQQVFAFRKAKIKLIEKYYSLYASHSYLYAQHGSTKFDSWGDFFLENKLRSYEFLIDSYGFSTDFKGYKLKINTLTRFYYYRIFYNIYGNFFWFFTGKELTFYINFSKNISRYVFLNKFYKNLFKNFITNNLKKFKNFDKLNKQLNAIYLNYNKIDEYLNLKVLYKKSINDLLFLKRTVFWKFFENFWDFRKLYPKIIDKISKLIVHHASYAPDERKKLMLLENFIYWEPTSWKIFDFYRAIYSNFIKVRYLLGKYELILNKYLKYKKFFFNYKRGFVKKFNLYYTKNKKNILLWKSKYWYKFKTSKDSQQLKGEYIIFNRYYNYYIKKQNKTFLFLYNEGIFNLLEQNSVYIKDWFINLISEKKDNLYIQKNNFKEISNNFFYIKKHKLSDIKKNYCYVKKVNSALANTVKFIKFIENKKFYKNNKKNLNYFLKNTNYKNSIFLKKNYNYLLKYNIWKKNNFFKFKKKLLLLNNNIKFLKKLNKAKRIKILLKFFKNWLNLVKIPRNESMLDNYCWYYFVFKARPKEFKWKWFKPFLRKKENVNWKKLYIFFKYRVMNSSFDYKSLRKKIRSQEYSKKKTEILIKKFAELHPYRKKMLEKQKKYPRYGLKLYKYFSNYKKLAPLFKQKVLKRFSQQNINLRFVRFSYARLFFIFWFISLRSHRNIEPKEMFLNKYYNRTNLYDFGSLLFLYLLKKPFYDFFSYYIRSILKFWLNIEIDFNYIIITNDELSAQFIANHIARALHFGYKWREVVKPIRKDLKNLLTRLRVLEKRPRNTYFTKYENYENYENTMYEYSFIYIKLHIKNYLLSFKYFFKFKKINNFIKNFYQTFKFVCYFKFVEVPEVIDVFEEAVQQAKIDNLKNNSKKKNFTIQNTPENLLQIKELPVFKKIIESNKNLVNNKIIINNDEIFKMEPMQRVDCIWSYTSFLNFFFKLKYFFFFLTLKLKKNFIYIRLNFIQWFKSWKKNFLNYHNQLFNFFFFNFYTKIINTISFNLVNQKYAHKKKFIYFFFFKFIKNKLYYKNLFFFNKNNDDIYKYFFFKKENTFNINNFSINFLNSLKIKKILKFILFLIKNKNTISKHLLNYFYLLLNNLNKFLKINKLNSFFLPTIYYRIYCIIKNNFLNYLKNSNGVVLKIKLFYKKFLILINRNLLNNKIKKNKIINFFGGYNSTLYRKPKGWIYLYYRTIFLFLKNYLNKLKKKNFLNFKNVSINIIVSIIKLFKLLNNLNNYSIQTTLVMNIKKYYLKKNIYFFINKINIINKNWNYKFLTKQNFSINFIYIKLIILLNNLFKKNFLFFSQFKFIYEKFFILNSINHWLNLPNLKISVLINLKKFDWNLLKIVNRSDVFNKNYLSKYSAFVKKKTFVDYFYQNRFLIGYKLRFAGRFKRRRKRTIMWLKKGLTPITAHDKWIDYGSHEIANEHSQYSVRIWLNKNKNVKYKHYLKF